jgi:hypothetical protein
MLLCIGMTFMHRCGDESTLPSRPLTCTDVGICLFVQLDAVKSRSVATVIAETVTFDGRKSVL